MRTFLAAAAMLIACTLSSPSSAADASAESGSAADRIATARLKLDTEQAAFKEKLETEKLQVERLNAWVTGISLMVPLMVAAITFAMGVVNQNRQSIQERDARASAERAQFELKAAEIVLNESGPVGSRNKARALKALFPNRLAADFVTSFNPEDYEAPEEGEPYPPKAFFFDVASRQVRDIDTLIVLWERLFPDDDWLARLKAGPAPRPPTSTGVNRG